MISNRQLAVTVLGWTMMLLTSCTTNNADNPVNGGDDTGLAEYTIIYYGNGGGNVDYSIIPMLEDFYKAAPEVYKRVNVVMQYKYSSDVRLKIQSDMFADDAELLGSQTVRCVVDPTKTFYSQRTDPANFHGERNGDITCPDSLTNYIKWAVKAYPAKKYMLILSDHGGGYRPDDDLPENIAWASRRGLLYDDGYLNENYEKKHFTVSSLTRAIRQSNVHFETIYMLACMMNNMEYLFEMKDLCDYYIASTYIMPNTGGALNVLAEQLAQHPTDVEQALAAFCKADVESWDEGWEIDETTPEYTDLTVTRTANLDQLGAILREFTDRLCYTYANGTAEQRQRIDECTLHCVKVHNKHPFYDIAKYISSIIMALPEIYDYAFYDTFADTFNAGLVAQYYSRYLMAHNYQVDYSVLLGAEGAYSYVTTGLGYKDGHVIMNEPKKLQTNKADGTVEFYDLEATDETLTYFNATFNSYGKPWRSTLADTYEQLTFDRIVGWSRWLKMNSQQPNFYSSAGQRLKLPDGDVSDDPFM